jgi:tRNA(Ile)-lysidine synthase
MALLQGASAWAARRSRPLLALTVDHGLHPDSAHWTAFAGVAARDVGAAWRPLLWQGDKPQTGLPAAARAARHGLLANAARDAGASVILFGHTADDVVEGELMRQTTAPTLGYLREWSPSPIWPEGREIFCLRPMLSLSRQSLRLRLSAAKRSWLEDPANHNLRFARARARTRLRSSDPPAGVPDPLPLDYSVPAPTAQQGLGRLAEHAQTGSGGQIAIGRTILDDADPTAVRRFLSAAVLCASGGARPPRGPAIVHLKARLAEEDAFTATLGGARLIADRFEVVLVREPGDLSRSGAEPLPLRGGETVVWDGRFEMTAEAHVTDITVAELAGAAMGLQKGERNRLREIPAAIRPALPALYARPDRPDGRVSLPKPFGEGPALARPLAGRRLAAACGLIGHERDISHHGMAQEPWSSYVEHLALA